MDQAYVCLDILPQDRRQLRLYIIIYMLQKIDRIVGIHLIDDGRQPLDAKLLRIALRIIHI